MSTAARRFTPVDAAIVEEVMRGLRASPKQLPCKFFYDDVGAALFERICTLDEYYPTRTELAILRRHVHEMAAWIGPDARIVEFGSGSGDKTRVLLRALEAVIEYVPIDIAEKQLAEFSTQLHLEMPALQVRPINADYTQPVRLPWRGSAARTVVFFPGSTIGNFQPDQARQFLRNAANLAGPAGGLLIGVDLKKDRQIIERAYNDAEGVTAAFNLNILSHVNRLCDADFNVQAFRHRAFYNETCGRIEMHLVSRRAQCVTLARTSAPQFVTFQAGESIVTEYSYKYSITDFERLAYSAGWTPVSRWQDENERFAVFALALRR